MLPDCAKRVKGELYPMGVKIIDFLEVYLECHP